MRQQSNGITRYRETRARTEQLCEPLIVEDYGVQPVLEVSPPKWHLAHTTWFFEHFLLMHHAPSYKPFHPAFDFLFNSYYKSIGPHLDRTRRGMLSRPGVQEVYQYRHRIDQAIEALIGEADEAELRQLEALLVLGIQHEEQHQELLLTDIKHIFWCNPLRPTYRNRLVEHKVAEHNLAEHESKLSVRSSRVPQIIRYESGLSTLGWQSDEFCFDNELPAHRVFLETFGISSHPVSCGEYVEFIEHGGYRNPSLWLSAGWEEVLRQKWEAPLYWEKQGREWWIFTLKGFIPLNESEPLCHVSFYEADAFARWKGMRLPTEAEWEHAAPAVVPAHANFADKGFFHPTASGESSPRFYGNTWEWTASSYLPYPGFKPLPAELGEYNGKFMCGQFVLRGGSCATPGGHLRPTYRNFFPPEARWQFSGVRLAP